MVVVVLLDMLKSIGYVQNAVRYRKREKAYLMYKCKGCGERYENFDCSGWHGRPPVGAGAKAPPTYPSLVIVYQKRGVFEGSS